MVWGAQDNAPRHALGRTVASASTCAKTAT